MCVVTEHVPQSREEEEEGSGRGGEGGGHPGDGTSEGEGVYKGPHITHEATELRAVNHCGHSRLLSQGKADNGDGDN